MRAVLAKRETAKGMGMSGGPCRFGMVMCLALLLGGVGCCGSKVLTLNRDKYINSGFDPHGSPLSVDVVCVFPSDLKGESEELNRMLAPNGGITADAWFDRKPTQASMQNQEAHPNHYRIHRDQIFSFTDGRQKDVYGKVEGRQIQGTDYAPVKGGKPITVRDIPVKCCLSGDSLIYVFCMFTNANGEVLATKPAVFHPAGDYGRNIVVHIGAEKITRTSKPK